MTVLTRDILIDRLRAATPVDGAHEQAIAPAPVTEPIASWAFDQFYAEEAGAVTFEAGYRRVIGGVLDDLMFSDQPGFALTTATIDHLLDRLRQAVAVPEDEDEDEEDDEDDDDNART